MQSSCLWECLRDSGLTLMVLDLMIHVCSQLFLYRWFIRFCRKSQKTFKTAYERQQARRNSCSYMDRWRTIAKIRTSLKRTLLNPINILVMICFMICVFDILKHALSSFVINSPSSYHLYSDTIVEFIQKVYRFVNVS